MMKRFLAPFGVHTATPLVAALALSLGTWASAAVMVGVSTVSFHNLGINTSNPLSLFDQSLGTLDSVDITIFGTLAVDAYTQFSCVPGDRACIPRPYFFTLELDVDGISDRFFNVDDLQFMFDGIAFPDGNRVSHVRNFSMDLTFSATTDRTGVALPRVTGVDVPSLAYGRRDNFIDNPFPLDMLFFQWRPSNNFPSLGVNPGQYQIDGDAIIFAQYHYTPVAVDAPPTIWLVLPALGALPLLRRRLGRMQMPTGM